MRPSRFETTLVVQSRPGHVLRAAWDHLTDRPCTLLLPGHRADVARFATRVAAVAEAHGALASPEIPGVVAFDARCEKPYVAFDCAAVADGAALFGQREADARVPFAALAGFTDALRRALRHAHAAPGGPRCLGRLSLANVLFEESGRWHLVGFGGNFPTEDEHLRVDPATSQVAAPELSVGGAPSPLGDLLALRLLEQSLATYAEVPAALRRVLRGTPEGDDEPLSRNVFGFMRGVVSAPPVERPGVDAMLAQWDAHRALLGVTPDATAFARDAARVLGGTAKATTTEVLCVSEGGAAVVLPDGNTVRLAGAAQKMILALAQAHAAGAPTLTVWDLVDRGWPDERVRATAATNRVYVTVNRIRAAGLRGLLERVEDGYRLAPTLRVKLVEP